MQIESWYIRNKEKNRKIAEFTKNFFRVFSVIKRYERGLGAMGLAHLKEEGEPVNAYDYDIKWAIREIDNLNDSVGQYSGKIENLFLASFDKIISELKERAEKFSKTKEI